MLCIILGVDRYAYYRNMITNPYETVEYAFSAQTGREYRVSILVRDKLSGCVESPKGNYLRWGTSGRKFIITELRVFEIFPDR